MNEKELTSSFKALTVKETRAYTSKTKRTNF